MAEPEARATHIDNLFPWLLHWTIADERIGGFRSDAFAVQTRDGLMVIDPLPLSDRLQTKLEDVGGILLTHGDHQRSAWRFRRELGARVYAPAGAAGLDEEPDTWYDETTSLPGGLKAIRATSFQAAYYLVFTHAEGVGVLFCGDLICHDPDGPYRFPVQPGYFDPRDGQEDARRLLDLPLSVLCAAHAAPSVEGCREALRSAINRLA
jgi:glyoxylase-like metal-dependent hydrolase (beta-lactamase superfamily II)